MKATFERQIGEEASNLFKGEEAGGLAPFPGVTYLEPSLTGLDASAAARSRYSELWGPKTPGKPQETPTYGALGGCYPCLISPELC